MRPEFHFDLVYVIARMAGIPAEDSYIIANCSQYVDDHYLDFPLRFNDGRILKQIATGYKAYQVRKIIPQDTGMETTLLFHFLPDSKDLHIVPEGTVAQNIVEYALAFNDPYLLGIVSHVIADTYSHCDFIGTYDYYNKVRVVQGGKVASSFLKYLFTFLPPLGHASVYSLPDIPSLRWSFKRGDDIIKVDNVKKTQAALLHLGKIFCKYSSSFYHGDNPEERYESFLLRAKAFLLPFIESLPIDSKECSTKINYYFQRNYFNITDLCEKDMLVSYDAKSWFSDTIELLKPHGIGNIAKLFLENKIFSYYPCIEKQPFESSHYGRFLRAAQYYKLTVVSECLNDILI